MQTPLLFKVKPEEQNWHVKSELKVWQLLALQTELPNEYP